MKKDTIVHAILEQMKAAGFRTSAAREAIVSALAKERKPLSVATLLERFSKTKKVFNKTTVYRELESLKRAGHVKELTLRNDTALYELVGEHHHHLTCVSCGDVRDVHLSGSLCEEERVIAKQEDFRILDHSFEFFGLCGKCS
jgi:Fe2+ or Zn2+ uptake regulation protein